MGAGSCGVCGAETVVDGARFCHACGAGLTTPVVDLNQSSGSPTAERRRSWRAWALAAGATAGVAGVISLLSALDGGANSDRSSADRDESAASEQSEASPEVDEEEQLPPGPSSTTTPAAPTTTVATTTTVLEPPRPVDVSTLPALDATHLFINSGRTLLFLDLETGVWNRREIASTVEEVDAVSGGVLIGVPSGAVRYANATGVEPVQIGDGSSEHFIGLIGDLVVFSAFDGVVLRELDGSEARRVALPDQSWPVGVTSAGQVIIQAVETVALYDPATEEPTTLGTGQFAGVVGNLVVVNSCDSGLECGMDQLDAETGVRIRVVDRLGWIESMPNTGRSVVRLRGGSAPVTLEVLDGVLTPTETDGAALPTGVSTTDPTTGITATYVEGTITFVDETGSWIAELPMEVRYRHRSSHIALVTLDDR